MSRGKHYREIHTRYVMSKFYLDLVVKCMYNELEKNKKFDVVTFYTSVHFNTNEMNAFEKVKVAIAEILKRQKYEFENKI